MPCCIPALTSSLGSLPWSRLQPAPAPAWLCSPSQSSQHPAREGSSCCAGCRLPAGNLPPLLHSGLWWAPWTRSYSSLQEAKRRWLGGITDRLWAPRNPCAKLGQAEGGVEVSEQGVMQGDIRDPTGNACKVVQDFIIWIQKQSSLMKDVP